MQYIYIILIFFALVFDRLNIFAYLIFSSLCHEAGHILVCKLLGYTPSVKLSIFGARLSGFPQNRYQKLAVIVAGPFVNLIFIIISLLILSAEFSLDIYIFCCINAVILLFNMLPVSFLDGGQIIGIFVQNSTIQKTLDILSFVLIFGFILYFSANIYHSFAAAAIFAVYYLFSKAK